ncbi:MAG: hypothetical protein LUH51_08730 [Firmicutes bacterium]|nr:hypothetical protein [Bacillota bacterium]
MGNGKYDDLLYLPHHRSATHAQMSMQARAVQFSPFAALTGYEDCIAEAGRQTAARPEQGEAAVAALDEALRALAPELSRRPRVRIRYFRPDERKSGGEICTLVGNLKEIDTVHTRLILADAQVIEMEDILCLEKIEEIRTQVQK